MYDGRYLEHIQYQTYLANLHEQQQEMNHYISECIALSKYDGTNWRSVVEEVSVINEANLSDKFKQIWTRIKSFFSKIYQKFLEKLEAWSNENNIKGYLEQYKGIILTKTPKITAKMKDHFTGIKNLLAFTGEGAGDGPGLAFMRTCPTSEDFNNITKAAGHGANATSVDKSQLSSDTANSNALDAYTIAQQELCAGKIPGGTNLVDKTNSSAFGDNIKEHFIGDSEIEYGSEELKSKMQIMYNFLYLSDTYISRLKKVREAYEAGMTKIEAEYKKAFESITKKYSEKKDLKAEADKTAKQNEIDKEVGDATTKATASNAQIKKEYCVYSHVYDKLLLEVEIGGNTSGSSSDDDNIIKQGYKGKDTPDDKAIKEKEKKLSQAGTNSKNTINSNTGAGKDVAAGAGAGAANTVNKTEGITDEQVNAFKTNAIDMLKAFGNTRNTVMGAALTALQKTRDDYWAVIRAHVQSYLGQENKAKDDNTETSEGKGGKISD